ncbi:MAG: hypothetical protein MJ033_03505 [Victivallaceae bacterium]|nr:hypothetical protein [Victivallaceae bacterium]
MIDLHCHILPALDDGAENENSASAMLRSAAASGVDVLAATSHYSRFAEENYDRVFAQIQELAKRENITLVPGMEYDYDRLTEIPPEKLRGVGGSQTLLLDLKESYVTSGVSALLFDLGLKGKSILIAHPERLWRLNYRDCLAALPQASISLQINSGSLLGCYGRNVRRAAWRILEEFPRCLIADDAHRASGFRFAGCREALLTAFDEGVVKLWMEVNPQRVLRDLPLLSCLPGGNWKQKLRRWKLKYW